MLDYSGSGKAYAVLEQFLAGAMQVNPDVTVALLVDICPAFVLLLSAITRFNRIQCLVSDVIAFNNRNAAKAMPFFKQETLESSQVKGDLTSKEYTEAPAKTKAWRQRIDQLMAAQKLDAIAGTSIGFAGCIDLINGDK